MRTGPSRYVALTLTGAATLFVSSPAARAAVLASYNFDGVSGSPTTPSGLLASASNFSGQFGAATTGWGIADDGGEIAAWNDGTAAAHSETDAKTGGYFWQFSVTPASTPLNLTDLDFDLGGERAGSGDSSFTTFYDAQYSFDNFATPGVSIGTGSELNSGNANSYTSQQLDLSGVAALQNAAAPVTFRFFTWHGPDSLSGTLFGNDTLANASSQETRFDNIVLQGTAVPEPAALSLLAMGGLLMGRRSRRDGR